jgi:predicted nucleotidyltransferase
MKYIKKYKLFESKYQYKKIEPILHDILLPLNDSDIKYVIYYNNNFTNLSDEVVILIEDKVEEFTDDDWLRVYRKFFTWKQIKSEILDVIYFMDSENIDFSKLEIQQFISNEYHNIEIYDESEIEELFEDTLKFTRFKIIFSKL